MTTGSSKYKVSVLYGKLPLDIEFKDKKEYCNLVFDLTVIRLFSQEDVSYIENYKGKKLTKQLSKHRDILIGVLTLMGVPASYDGYSRLHISRKQVYSVRYNRMELYGDEIEELFKLVKEELIYTKLGVNEGNIKAVNSKFIKELLSISNKGDVGLYDIDTKKHYTFNIKLI
jgi:hypothetical protein